MSDNIKIGSSRQQLIIDILTENNVMSIKDLAKEINVSPVTVRRDLESLEIMNVISKFHGSVSIVKQQNPFDNFILQLKNNSEIKKALATVATTLIKPNSTISVDSGTTTYLIADQIPQNYKLKVITNCLITGLRFAENPHTQSIQVGGVIQSNTNSTTDFLAEEFINKFKTNIAFITSNAFDANTGAYDSVISLISVKRAFTQIAERVVVMVDSSKFKRNDMYLSVPLKIMDTIITDKDTPREAIEALRDINKEIIIVDPVSCSIVEHINKL